MTKKYYDMLPMILPCNLKKGQIIEHGGIEKVVSKTIKADDGGVTTYVYFEGQKGYVEYSNSFEREVLGHVEQLEEPENDDYVNFEDRRHALLCSTNVFAQKTYVEPSEITDFAEYFEQWLKR